MSTDKNASKRETAPEEDVLTKLRASLEKDPPQTNKKNIVQDKDLESALRSAIAAASDSAEKTAPAADAAVQEPPVGQESADEVTFDDIFGAAFAEDTPAETAPEPLPEENAESAAEPQPAAPDENVPAAERIAEPETEPVSAEPAEPIEPAESAPAAVSVPETAEPLTSETSASAADVGTDAAAVPEPAETAAAPEEPAAENSEPETEPETPAAEKDLPLEKFNAYLASLLASLPQEGQPRIFTDEEAFSALNTENNAPATASVNEAVSAVQTDVQTDDARVEVPVPSASDDSAPAPAAEEPSAIPQSVSVPDTDAPAADKPTPHVKWVGTVPDQPTQATAAQQKPTEQTAAAQNAPAPNAAAETAPGETAAHDNRENMTARNIADTIAANLRRQEEEKRRAGMQTLPNEDMALLLHLGYEADLASVTGYGPIEKMKRGTNEDASVWPPHDSQYTGVEYDMTSEKAEEASRAKIRHRFRVYRVFNALRTAVTLLIALFALYYDITPVLQVPFLSYLNKTERPVFYTAFGALLLLVSVLLSGRTIVRGAKQMFSMRPNSISVPIVVCLSLLVYDVIAVMTGASDVLQLNSVGVVSMLAVTIRDAMYVKAEKTAFGVVSRPDAKYAVEPLYEEMSGFNKNSNSNSGRPRNVWISRPVTAVRHFRARFHEAEPNEKTLPYMLPLTVLLSLAAGLLGLLRGNTLFVAYSWAEITLLCLLPAFVTIHFAYPWLASERLLAKLHCTMIGRNAPWLYAGQSMLLFPDSVVLEARNSTEMHVKNAGDTTLYISRLRKLFDTVGGTLGGILAKSTIASTVEQLQITALAKNGLQADFIGTDGGKTAHAIVGIWKYMQENGINAPTEGDTRIKRNSMDTGLLYAAFDGELKLIFEVEYGVYAGFLGTVPGLSEYGIATGIYTEDPVLNDEFVGRCLGVVKRNGHIVSSVNVWKPKRHRELPMPEETSSAMIACGSASRAAHGLAAAAGLRQIYRIGALMRWLAMIVGGILALDMMLLSDMGSMPALRVLLLQLIWLVPVMIITRLYLIREDKDCNNGKRDSVTGADTSDGRKK